MAEVKLPEGWLKTKIDEIAEVKGGKRLPKGKALLDTVTEHPYVRVTDFENGSVDISNLKYLDSDTFASIKNYTISKDDLYISIAGTIGLVGEIPDSIDGANLTENAAKICSLTGVHKKYLRYVLNGISAKEQFDDKTTSSGQPKLALFRIKDCTFPLPPKAEQKVIANKLDILLGQVETIKARLDRIPQILKTFRQSVLSAAVSGRLTKEWRELNKNESAILLKDYWLHEREERFNEKQEEDIRSGKIKRPKKFKLPVRPDLETGPIDKYPETWALVSVSEFAECLDSDRIPVKKDLRLAAEGLYPYFGANGEVDKVDEYIFDDELVLVTEDETFYGRVKPIAYRFSGKCWVNNHAHVLRAPTKIANDYLCFSLMYYKVIPWLSGTTGRAKLTQAALNSLPIGMPPEKEQTEIVRRVEELFAFADNIEQKAYVALERVNNLTQSILAKAFRGELTAQWRKDNPDLINGDNSAESLLARIKSERDALSSKKKSKKKSAVRKKA